MLDVALKLLNEITSHNYKAYIVGGFVRDHIMGIESNDVDITTNATPKQIKEIFEDSCLPNEDYGSVTVIKKGIRFEITTFRKESEYINNRKPSEIKYIDDLYQDLIRRDFIINTLCIDYQGNIIDVLGGQEDINNKIIRTVGDAENRFNEDCLRILRAVRFATILNFNLSDEIINAIGKTKHLLKNLSYYRKKSELEKIFTSSNHINGIKLLIDLGLDKELEIPNLYKILETDTTSLIGIWSLLNVSSKYPFNKNELDLINNINKVLNLNNMDPVALYKYGLYVNSVAGEIKGTNIKSITECYNSLVIKVRSDINITSSDIMKLLDKGPGKYIKDIFDDIEREILYHRLENSYDNISQYIISKYRI
jgi:tRNA nucleotidyltransferase (CCA-adding enzyme)